MSVRTKQPQKRISRNEDETGASNAFSFSPARIVDPLKIAPAPSAVPDAIRPEKQPTLRTFWARINSYLRPSNPRKTPTRRHYYSLRWDSPSFWFGLARLLTLSLSLSLSRPSASNYYRSARLPPSGLGLTQLSTSLPLKAVLALSLLHSHLIQHSHLPSYSPPTASLRRRHPRPLRIPSFSAKTS